MKYGMLALVAGGLLLAGCGGSNSTSSGLDAQSKQLQRSTKSAQPASYEDVVQSLYIAYFGRPADPAGLANFEVQLAADNAPTNLTDLVAAYSTNASVKTLIDSFGTSAESQSLYGSGDTTDFVIAVFQHVLGRNPATAGQSFYVNAIANGSYTQGQTALAVMSGAETNTTTQGLLDAQLVKNRITASEYFTNQVSAQYDMPAYAGTTAATQARNMLTLVTASTDVNAFQSQESTVVAGLTISGTTTPYTGATLVQFATGTSDIYDAAGNTYGIDASTGALVSKANNVYLSGLTVAETGGDWYVMRAGNIIGFLAYVSASSSGSAIGFYYTGENKMSQMQITASPSAWTVGCASNCAANVSNSASPVALQEIDTTTGTGAMATVGKTVTVTYTGYLYNVNATNFEGSEFDSSSLHTGSYTFVLGAGTVIGGWDIGVQGMKVGGTRTLIIPSILGYGSQANGSIPANAGLVFTVQVLSVQ